MESGSERSIEAGVFLVDKPVGITSFGVVGRMRKILRMKKVGHAGTLDPFATGLLIVCAGRPATKLISRFMDGEKEYIATLCLGVETETLDTEGEVVNRTEVGTISEESIEDCLASFRGKQMQTPPAYSALKHKGKPLYYYARKGIKIEKEPREIEVSTLERIGEGGDIAGKEGVLNIRVVCSKGTYIRTLAADIGEKLGCGAHLTGLRRTKSGIFHVDNALNWEELSDADALNHTKNKMICVEEVAKLLQ